MGKINRKIFRNNKVKMEENIYKKNTDNLRELAHGAGISFVFVIAGYILMFLFKLIAARYLGPEKYGIYEMLNTILTIAILICSFGILSGITRYIPYYFKKNEKHLLRGYLNFIIRIPIIISIIVSLLIFVGAKEIGIFFNLPNEFSLFLRIISVFIPLKVASQVLRQIIVSRKKIFFQSFSINFLEKFVLFAGLILVFIFKLSFIYIAFLLIASIVIPFLFDFTIYKRKLLLPRVEKSESKYKEWLFFSIPLFFSGFFAFIMHWTDNLFIGKLLDVSMLGIYAIAYSIGDSLGLFQNIFTGIFSPLIAEKFALNKNEEINFIFRKVASWSFGLALPLFTFFLAFGKDFLSIVYGKEYSDGYLPLIIISSGMLIFLMAGANESVLITHKKTKFIFKVNIFVLFINVILNIVLIKLIGITGAALASALSLLIRSFLTFTKAKKIVGISIDIKYNLKFLFAGLLSFLSAIFFKKLIHVDINLYSLIIFALGILIFYILTSLLLKNFSKEDRDIFKLFLIKLRLLKAK